MTLSAAVCTTFPDDSWNVYSKRMLESFIANWPVEVPILVQTDTATLAPEINKILRESDGLKSGWEPDHKAFVERNKGKDDPQDYRKQAVKFCHKVFAIKFALESIKKAKADKAPDAPRHLIWLDADVITTRKVTPDDIIKCLPKEGDAVSYMGRKDWQHSECGWLAFDLENGGDTYIDLIYDQYVTDAVFAKTQWHDSWIFDLIRKDNEVCGRKATNLTATATGMEVWPQSPMASWSRHYKGQAAKQELAAPKQSSVQNLKIQTVNSLPDEALRLNILENQTLIKNWISPCKKTAEEIVVVSAGPMLIAEDLLEEVAAGRRIVAVKHALEPLKAAGIKPWACILLDPRDHVYKFVENPDKDIIWLVASQVTPKAVKHLIDSGCTVWGYHAAVGAGETPYTDRQPQSIVTGGSATATRGLFVLEKLGFCRFRLYGYDLCLDKKPNLNEKDERGQPKYFEIEMGYNLPFYNGKRWFWSKGELLAQADEFRMIMESMKWEIQAFGCGIVPFLTNVKRISNLRQQAKIGKMKIKLVDYEDMLRCRKKTLLSMLSPKRLLLTLRNLTKASNY